MRHDFKLKKRLILLLLVLLIAADVNSSRRISSAPTKSAATFPPFKGIAMLLSTRSFRRAPAIRQLLPS